MNADNNIFHLFVGTIRNGILCTGIFHGIRKIKYTSLSHMPVWLFFFSRRFCLHIFQKVRCNLIFFYRYSALFLFIDIHMHDIAVFRADCAFQFKRFPFQIRITVNKVTNTSFIINTQMLFLMILLIIPVYNEIGVIMSYTKTSKYISLILRHKPEVIGITLDEHGWANVYELIDGVNKTHPINMDVLEEIVRTDEKQRYSFNNDKTKIRANQGHSISVDVELEEKEPPEYLFHGTGEKFVSSIDQQGLISKTRLYVHLSKDPDTAVKVGQRHGKPVVYTVSSGKMYRDGFIFFLSQNGVWLTKEVPAKYLDR